MFKPSSENVFFDHHQSLKTLPKYFRASFEKNGNIVKFVCHLKSIRKISQSCLLYSKVLIQIFFSTRAFPPIQTLA